MLPSSEPKSPEKSANIEFRKGIEAQLKGKNDLAQSHYLAALKRDAKFAPALIGLADIALRQGNRSQAETYLKQADAAAPKAAEVHLAWGRFYLGTKQFEQAEASFKLARDLNPKAVPPLLELGDLYLRDTSRRSDAADSFAAAVALEPGNKFAVYSYGVASAMLGRRDDALKAFEKAAELAPRDPAPLRAAGRLYLEAGDTDKALKSFDLGLKRQPNFVPLMLDRSDALARQGKWPEAIRQLNDALRVAPKSSEVRVKLGDAYQSTQQWDKARAAYTKAIELNDKNPLAYNNLAWMMVQQGVTPEKAVEAAKKAVSLAPDSAPFLDTLGWAQRAAGDLPAAAESLQRATKIEPNSSEFQLHYGIILLDLKRTADAREALNRAIDPHSPKTTDEAKKLLRTLQAN
ncbi:tetratricopeptide repeat protein [Candidatus Propionivibrio aalborgensis]|uniref:tetratricopeptide repeat protein n=1 Tax=Candidatus Propionivibrio aalborgensis TaxID=1860101 RepID=UPI00164411AF|nr:tetratricopeptide repeat protein [Candidatus Propionivibrio aalborgensis]